METVFVYGTLRDKDTRKRLCGRDVYTENYDCLKGFELSSIHDENQSFPILVENDLSDQIINGEIIELSRSELLLIDQYEGSFYRRIKITLESGKLAWVYIK
jgi:gamma-glutamylcyclotransferase (GGCT)/AIG2-like uncharacterized protein YtfP